MTQTQGITTQLHFARTITFLLYGVLLISFCIWQLTREPGPSYFFWFVQTFPLIIFIPGMKHNNPRAYIMLCFMLLMYFIQGVGGVMSPNPQWIDYVILSISTLLFISAMLTSRWAAMSQTLTKTQNTEFVK